ncbi:hypothetical protein ACFXBB_17780 [Streptomyces scopuliridis]|uniref:hypothetical protein n=1 Tax=Streptomyces scopuliridis TaxID=452529 RepID=UPI00369E1046
MVRLGWITSPLSIEVRFGTARAGAINVVLDRTADIDALPVTRTEADWEQPHAVEKVRRTPGAPRSRRCARHRRQHRCEPPGARAVIRAHAT